MHNKSKEYSRGFNTNVVYIEGSDKIHFPQADLARGDSPEEKREF